MPNYCDYILVVGLRKGQPCGKYIGRHSNKCYNHRICPHGKLQNMCNFCESNAYHSVSLYPYNVSQSKNHALISTNSYTININANDIIWIIEGQYMFTVQPLLVNGIASNHTKPFEYYYYSNINKYIPKCTRKKCDNIAHHRIKYLCVNHCLTARCCQDPFCRKRSSYNYEGQQRGIFCSKHKFIGMVNVILSVDTKKENK